MSFSLTATATPVLFVCTRNQARSQFAAALFEQHTGIPAFSAGARPAQAPDPEAVAVAAHSGLDPSRWTTCSYNDITTTPAVVISVCDRAYEAGMPFTGELRHWSIPDPAGQPRAQYEHTLRQLNARITRLVVNQNQAISA